MSKEALTHNSQETEVTADENNGSVMPIALLTALCETTIVELRQRKIDETTANYIDFSEPGSRTGQY